MTTPIYTSTIGAFIRQSEALAAIMAKGRDHLGEEADAFVNARLIEDMAPFSFQIRSVAHHGGTIEALRSGKSGPPPALEVTSYAQLEELLASALEKMRGATPEELDSLLEADVVFSVRDRNIPFKGLGYLTSFALPNFYFHVTTAYNLLRQKGVQLGKGDYLGALDLNLPK